MFGIIVVIAAIGIWYKWYASLSTTFAPAAKTSVRILLGFLPVVCLVIFSTAFFLYADPSATDDIDYSLGFIGLFLFSLRLILEVIRVIGIQPLNDSLERANPAVIPAVVGTLLGTTALNIGANIGQGDEIGTTLFPLAMGLALWIGFGVLLGAITPLIERITVTRESLAGLTFGLIWFSASLPLARAAAGDWVSFAATTIDFAGALPALLALLITGRLLASSPWKTGFNHKTVVLIAVCATIVTATLLLPLASAW
jgi:hypothetical protein